jgi:hypothetical protein
MPERTTRASGADGQITPPRPEGRRRQATKRSLYLRSTIWGAVTLSLIVFLGWFIFWANEAGGMLP